MKVYIDDMVVRSYSVESHVRDLESVFDQVKSYNMRLNLAKCTFGVGAGKFLSFILIARGIGVNPNKCATIVEM